MNYIEIQVRDEINYTIKGEITWTQESNVECDVC